MKYLDLNEVKGLVEWIGSVYYPGEKEGTWNTKFKHFERVKSTEDIIMEYLKSNDIVEYIPGDTIDVYKFEELSYLNPIPTKHIVVSKPYADSYEVEGSDILVTKHTETGKYFWSMITKV